MAAAAAVFRGAMRRLAGGCRGGLAYRRTHSGSAEAISATGSMRLLAGGCLSRRLVYG